MGPYHDFFLVSRSEHDWTAYSRFIRDPSAIRISDYLLGYMVDSLRWIPTLNPATGEAHKGLCWYGPTVIWREGAHVAEQVFSAWANLLDTGPPTLELTGPYTWIEGESSKDGGYERLIFPKDATVSSLRELARCASSVAVSDGALYLLHLGI